ncbi:MAG: HD domain-containing protein [Nitrospirae bacterium]|nr:HD domain-containing protein [Nitrospirota bacterium]
MIIEPQVRLFDIIKCLSRAMDLISPEVVNHHERVAYIAFSIGAELGLSVDEQSDLILAGALHDSGALSIEERIDFLEFETKNPYRHAELGYMLLKGFDPLAAAARLVRYHHVPWNNGKGVEFRGNEVPTGSHILHLADRVAVLINNQQEVLGQGNAIISRINEQSGRMFMPQLVEVFNSLATREYFWLDVASHSISSVLQGMAKLKTVKLDMQGLLCLSDLFRQIIDFRSRFTATHSAGVAVSAVALAGLAGFSERECRLMRIAGHLHDLGKLAVPVEILEKQTRLTVEEIKVIKSHTFYTFRILEHISALDTINAWGSFHHERIDGSGYPFHHKGSDLSLGSRIMAVADVFTAITEDRPYRKGMSRDRTIEVLRHMADDRALDADIVSLLCRNIDEINSLRKTAQKSSVEEYRRFVMQANQ